MKIIQIDINDYVDNDWKGSIKFNATKGVKFNESDLLDFTITEAISLKNHIMENIE